MLLLLARFPTKTTVFLQVRQLRSCLQHAVSLGKDLLACCFVLEAQVDCSLCCFAWVCIQ